MLVYLDNSATTKPCPQAVEAMVEALEEGWGNPSALYRFGMDAAHRLKTAREQVAKALGAEPDRVFFTSGGTEADNWAIFSSLARMGKRGKHIITTAVEHHAVLNPMKRLEEQGFQVTYLKPDHLGRVGLETLREALTPDTVFVSVMMVNNESGAVMPISQMAKLTHRVAPDAIFHTDAVQGFLKIPFQAKALGADLISVSSHKVHGPKGAGALYIRRGLPLPAFLLGGGQEQGFRSGTEAMPAVAGFGAACAAALPTLKEDLAREEQLRELAQSLLEGIPGVKILGAHEAPHILSVSLPGVPTQNTINLLQDQGVCVSAGSACAKGHRSHVLEAMGLAPDLIDGAFRVSLSRYTTEEEIRILAEAVSTAAARWA